MFLKLCKKIINFINSQNKKKQKKLWEQEEQRSSHPLMFIFLLCSYCEALPISDLFFNNKHMMQPFLLYPLDYGHG